MKKLLVNMFLILVTLFTSTISYADNESLESVRKISLEQALKKPKSIKYPSNTYKYKNKERNLAKIQSSLENIKKLVEFDIRGKYDNVENEKKQIELAKAKLEKAKEGLKIKKSLYDAKMGTLLEVDNALNQLYNAQISVANVTSNYNLAVLDYNKAVSIGNIR